MRDRTSKVEKNRKNAGKAEEGRENKKMGSGGEIRNQKKREELSFNDA
jgi:hypothetical protein